MLIFLVCTLLSTPVLTKKHPWICCGLAYMVVSAQRRKTLSWSTQQTKIPFTNACNVFFCLLLNFLSNCLRKTSQELRMLSRLLSDCKSLLPNVMIQASQFVSKGRHEKNRFFLGNSPKQRTPPTHPYGLGLT